MAMKIRDWDPLRAPIYTALSTAGDVRRVELNSAALPFPLYSTNKAIDMSHYATFHDIAPQPFKGLNRQESRGVREKRRYRVAYEVYEKCCSWEKMSRLDLNSTLCVIYCLHISKRDPVNNQVLFYSALSDSEISKCSP